MSWRWYEEQINNQLCEFLDMFYEEYSPGEFAILERMKNL